MRAVPCLLLLLCPAVGWAEDVRTVVTVRQGDRSRRFEDGLGTFYEGLVVAVLGTCSVDDEATRDRWEKALKADHLLVQFARPCAFAVDVETRQVAADEIVVTLSPTALPDAILVRSGKTYRAFGKSDPRTCLFIQEQLKSLPPAR